MIIKQDRPGVITPNSPAQSPTVSCGRLSFALPNHGLLSPGFAIRLLGYASHTRCDNTAGRAKRPFRPLDRRERRSAPPRGRAVGLPVVPPVPPRLAMEDAPPIATQSKPAIPGHPKSRDSYWEQSPRSAPAKSLPAARGSSPMAAGGDTGALRRHTSRWGPGC
jgi:hypothetical protein